jgi:hypothetical protein
LLVQMRMGSGGGGEGQLTSDAASVLSCQLWADDFEAALLILVVVANAEWVGESADGEEWDNESESEMHGC